MNLDQIFRTATAFLNEYDLPDTYATALPHEDYPTLSLVYADHRGDELSDQLMWESQHDEHEVARITYNGLHITVSTYWGDGEAP